MAHYLLRNWLTHGLFAPYGRNTAIPPRSKETRLPCGVFVKGNNVRFGGINVGTVERTTVSSDTSVFVEMAIRQEMSPFIKKTALASLGSDGLMGNAVIDLSAVADPVPSVVDGDILRSVKPLAINDLMNTLDHSSNNLSAITDELRTFTGRLNQSPLLRSLLTNETMASDLLQTTASLRIAGTKMQSAATDIRQVTGSVRAGRGNLGYLLKDSTLATDLRVAMGSLRRVGSKADTLFNGRLQNTMGNVEQGTARLNENMKALQSNFLFRRYFRKKKP